MGFVGPPVFHGCLVTWNSRKPPHVRTHRVLRRLVIRLTAYLLFAPSGLQSCAVVNAWMGTGKSRRGGGRRDGFAV
jgi:hypothetical protein